MKRQVYNLRKIDSPYTGVNNVGDPSEIHDTDMYDCRNVSISSRGIKTAEAFTPYGYQPYQKIYGIFCFKENDGSDIVLRQSGDKLQYDPSGSGSFYDCTLPTTGSPSAPVSLIETKCSFAMLNDIILWSNGEQTVMSSSDAGVTWVLQPSLPVARKLFNNGLNRILFTRIINEPSKVYWSDINDPLTVGASSYQFININDGQEIQDIVGTPSGGVIIFKSNSVYTVSDISLNTLSVDRIGEAGCVPNTAVATENSAIWLSTDGKIYQYAGGIQSISDQLKPIFIPESNSYHAVYYDRKYRLACSTSDTSTNDIEVIVDRTVGTTNPYNPYAITINEREYNCYAIQSSEEGEVLFVGGCGQYTYGSPAVSGYDFGYIDQSRDEEGDSATIRGNKQLCYFETKFFGENSLFFLKRYVKIIVGAMINDTTTFRLKYKYVPYGSYEYEKTDIIVSASNLEMIYDSLEEGDFVEGFGFAYRAFTDIKVDMESGANDCRGVQVRIEWESNKSAVVLESALKYLQKTFFT